MKGVSTCVLCGVGVIIMEGRSNLKPAGSQCVG